MKGLSLLVAVAVPFLWGFGFTLAKPAVTQFPSFLMMTLVYTANGMVLARHFVGMRTPWRVLALAGGLGALNNGLIFASLDLLPASTAVLLLQSEVPMAVILAWLVGAEALNPRRLLGIVVAIGGVGLIVGAPESGATPWAVALMLAGGLCWAISQVIVRTRIRDDGLAVAASMALYGVPACALGSALTETGQLAALRSATVGDWGALAAVAFISFTLGQTAWFWLLRRHRVDQVTPFVLLMPAVGFVTGAVMLGEAITLVKLAGAAVIIGGLALVVVSPEALRRLKA
ncbi:MAG: DMT family transporter [Alphaproteobacteria bacterium]|nr:DMT family transporter [Alphaproteobacteria bacterium]